MGLGQPVRVLVVDDHALVREGLFRVLEAEPGLEAVAEAASGEQALAIVAEAQPDIVVLGIRLPGMSGLELIRALRASHPRVRMLVLSAYPEYVSEALMAGASGYLLKTAGSAELVAMLRAVAVGATVVQDALAQGLGLGFRPAAPETMLLTPRELEVLRLMVRGLTNRAIARELGIGTRTADQHVHSIFVRTRIRSRAEAVRYALEHRLVALDSR